MSAFSNYLEGKIVDHFLRNTSVSSPTTVYLALFESDPGEDASGTETAYTGYARQASTWTVLDGAGETKNNASVSFPANGNASASVTISHAAIFDSFGHEVGVIGFPKPEDCTAFIKYFNRMGAMGSA